MQIVILKDSAEVAEYGANLIINQLKRKPDSVLGLATGSTPVSLYQRLVAANQAGAVSFEVVPLALGRAAYDLISKAGYSSEWHTYPMGHSVLPNQLQEIGLWLKARLSL